MSASNSSAMEHEFDLPPGPLGVMLGPVSGSCVVSSVVSSNPSPLRAWDIIDSINGVQFKGKTAEEWKVIFRNNTHLNKRVKVRRMFHYKEGIEVPQDVAHVLIDSSVTKILPGTFADRRLLREVVISTEKNSEGGWQGLVEIGKKAFHGCSSLTGINIPHTVRVIGNFAFGNCFSLRRLRLPEGLLEIHQGAFNSCALEQIKMPSTVRSIGRSAFAGNLLLAIDLPDSLNYIGPEAFQDCDPITSVRIPPLVTTLSEKSMLSCLSMFSLELPEGMNRICKSSLSNCDSLRNVAIPQDARSWESFESCYDLYRLFGSSTKTKEALIHRFDGLPIHRLMYYQSYHVESTLGLLRKEVNLRSGQSRTLRTKLNPTGNKQDSLGMTPLHILACSKKPKLDLFKMIIDNYPENLVTEDMWGELPLYYIAWGSVSQEIMLFLAESLKSHYPNYQLKWGRMIKRLSLSVSGIRVIHNLVEVHRRVFSHQVIDWDELLDELAAPKDGTQSCTSLVFRYLILCCMRSRMKPIPIKTWGCNIKKEIYSLPSDTDDFAEDIIYLPNVSPDSKNSRKYHLDRIRAKVADYECEYARLKEATTTLELATWNAKINDTRLAEKAKRSRKRIKFDDSYFRSQCRISCGADIVIENVLPYLVGL